MNQTPRILSIVIIVLSGIFLALSLAGLVTVWAYNGRLTERAMSEIETIEADLKSAQATVTLARAELESVQSQIDLLQSALDTLGVDANSNLQRLADIVSSVEGTLTPLIDRVASALSGLREALLKIVDTIERLNALPLVNIEIPGVEQIEAGAQQLQDLQTQIEEGGDNVERLSRTTQELVDSLTNGFADLEKSVTALLNALPEFEARIVAYQERLAYLKANLPGWIDWASAILTVFFLWLGLSQVGLVLLAWPFFSGQDPLARWRQLPPSGEEPGLITK